MIRKIWDTLTKEGKRSLLRSVAGFVLYALFGAAMILLMLNGLMAVFVEGVVPRAYPWLLCCCLLLKGSANMLADWQKHFAGFDLVYEIRAKIIRRLKTFSLGFYTNERLGEISTMIHKDVDNMEMVVGHMWTRMAADFIVSLVLLIFLLFVSAKMTLILIAPLPAALIYLASGLGKASRLEAESGDSLADMVSLFVEYVKGIPLLKAFSESRKFDQKLSSAAADFGERSKFSAKYKASVLSRYALWIDLTWAAVVVSGIGFMIRGTLSATGCLIFVILGREFFKPFIAMEAHWMNWLKVTDSFRRIRKITAAPSIVEPARTSVPETFSITFENVGFAYEAGGFKLDGISFQVPNRTLTALVGESGSGKTTVTNLLLRFWDVDCGKIRIGNVDVRDMRYDDLLGCVSIVMQDVRLFADTIEGNIRIGKAGATRTEIIEAAKKARIHDFILTLPEGYQTVVGENGVGLSGGQKQRISIARAFLKDTPILLLDEMTSNVDPVNEALIQEAVSELARDRTVLVIAHHLSTIRSADQILVFKKGTIVQAGKHEDLLSDPEGTYRKLWLNGIGALTPEGG